MKIATVAMLLASASAVSLRSEKNKLGECALIKDKDACCASAQCGKLFYIYFSIEKFNDHVFYFTVVNLITPPPPHPPIFSFLFDSLFLLLYCSSHLLLTGWNAGKCDNLETGNVRGECEGKGEEADVSGAKEMGDKVREAGKGSGHSTTIIRYPAMPPITPPCTGADCQPEENPLEGDKSRKGPGAIAKRAWDPTNKLQEGGFLRPLIKSINTLEVVGKSLNEKLKALRTNHIANQISLAKSSEKFQGEAKQDYENQVKVANMFSDEIIKWRTVVLKTKFNFENYNKKMASLEEASTKQLADFGADVIKQETDLKKSNSEFTEFLQKVTDHHKKIEDAIAAEKGKEGDIVCKKDNEEALEATMVTGPVYSNCKDELDWLTTKGLEKIKECTDLHAQCEKTTSSAREAVQKSTEAVSKGEADLEKSVADGILKIQAKEKEMFAKFHAEVAEALVGKKVVGKATNIERRDPEDPEEASFISLSESNDDVVEKNPATADFAKLNQQVNAIDTTSVDGNVEHLNTDLYSSGMTHVDTWITKLKDHLDVLKGYYKYYQVGASQKDKKFRTQHDDIKRAIVECSQTLKTKMMALKNDYRKLLFALSKFQKALDDTVRHTSRFTTDLTSINTHKKVCYDLQKSGFPTIPEELKDCKASEVDDLKLDESFDDFTSYGAENVESMEANQDLEDMMALYGNEAATEEDVQVSTTGE
jgi:hypothetical protein